MAENRIGKEPAPNAAENEENSSYQVVARRYRPQGFDALIGQDHVAKALMGAIASGRVGHAYLFTGARGVGKTSSARILAKALNCVHGPTPTPCNECEICQAISTGDDIDVLEIDGASNRGIDEIRQLRQSATIKPSRARYKIYIIDEVHMLTREAFNALLKILEEPPEHVKFIFCTTEPNKLPITILSRCQRFDFAGIDTQMIAEHLRYIARNEGVAADEGVCETLARRANGSMRDAQSLLEQLLSFAPDHITLADVNGMLGTVDDQKIFDLIAQIQNGTPGGLFPILAKAAGEGVDFGVLLEQMIGVFRDLLVVSLGCSAKMLAYSSPGRFGEIQQIAESFGVERILASMQIISQTISRMRYSTQGRILAEMALVRLCALDRLTDAVRLIEQLRAGQISPAVPAPQPLPQKKTSELALELLNNSPPPVRPTPPPAAQTSPASPPRPRVSHPPVPTVPPPAEPAETAAPEPKPSLSSLSQTELLTLWRRVTGRFGVTLSIASRACSRLDWNGSVLRIGFPPDKERDQATAYCAENKSKISQTLSEFVAETPVPIEIYRTDEPIHSAGNQPPKPKPKKISPTQKYEDMREKMELPIVKEIEKEFGGILEDVKDPHE